MAITPENVFPAEFERRLDVWRFRYWDRIDEFNDLYDLDELPDAEWYCELAAEGLRSRFSSPPSTGSTATPVTTRKAA